MCVCERERGSVCNINSIEITIHRNKRVCVCVLQVRVAGEDRGGQ